MAGERVLLVTRPEAQGQAFVEALDLPAAVHVILSPILAIAPCPVAPFRTGTLVLTSANAVPAAMGVAAERIYVVGESTAAAAAAAGLTAVSADGDADALVALLMRSAPPEPIVHLRGAHVAGRVAERLRDAGHAVQEIVAYDQVARSLSAEARTALAGTAEVVVPLFSPRSAALFAEAATGARAPLLVVAMSPAVAEAAGPALAERLTVVAAPTGAAMRAEVLRRLRPTSRLETPGSAG